jgi:hypothetical protein
MVHIALIGTPTLSSKAGGGKRRSEFCKGKAAAPRGWFCLPETSVEKHFELLKPGATRPTRVRRTEKRITGKKRALAKSPAAQTASSRRRNQPHRLEMQASCSPRGKEKEIGREPFRLFAYGTKETLDKDFQLKSAPRAKE